MVSGLFGPPDSLSINGSLVTVIINDTVAAVATEAKHLPFLGSGPGRG